MRPHNEELIHAQFLKHIANYKPSDHSALTHHTAVYTASNSGNGLET